MVFASLTQQDKEAFFALLDEYFESRPHLFAGLTKSSTVTVSSAASTTNLNRAPSRPVPSAAITNSPPQSRSSTPPVPKPRVVPPAVPTRKLTTPRIVEPASNREEPDNENVDAAPVSVASRIAAAQAALGPANTTGNRPPVPTARRFSSNPAPTQESRSASPPPPPQRSHTPLNNSVTMTTPVSNGNSYSGNGGNTAPNGLVSSKSIGNIDTSSPGAAVVSVFSSKKKPTGTGVYVAPKSAFERTKTKDTFGPPPSRSPSASQTNLSKREEAHGHGSVEEEGGEEEYEGQYSKGEWVEALYDFNSQETTDLCFKTGQQIFVTERSSKDWWMGELDGKEGLIPSAYVKVI